jgi:hypothetical protein
VREAHKIWIALVNRTVELEGKARDRDSRIELLRHQVNELKALDLKDGEVAQLGRRTHASFEIAAGWPRRRRRPSACCTTRTKATRTPRHRAPSPASRPFPASIRASPR